MAKIASTIDPTQRSTRGVIGQTGLFHLMDSLAKHQLTDASKQQLCNTLANSFNIPHPVVQRNNRLTSCLGRCTTSGIIQMGRDVDRADTLVHEFAHHLVWQRHGYHLVPGHGLEFTMACEETAVATFPLLGAPIPEWQPTRPPQFDFEHGQRVQVNPYRPGWPIWFGTVEGFSAFKVWVRRQEPGHKKHLDLYRIAPNLLATAEIPLGELDDLDNDLDDMIDALIKEGKV